MALFASKSENREENKSIIRRYIKESRTGIGFLGEASLNSAAKMLRPDEVVIYAIYAVVSLDEPQGTLKVKMMSIKDKISGVVVITNERIIFSAASGYSASKSIFLVDVDAIDSSSMNSIVGAVLRVQSRSTSLAIDGNKKTLTQFQTKLDEAVHAARILCAHGGNTVVQQLSAADEIMKYKNLFDAGVITDEEFQAKKKQLLDL